MYLKRIEIHGFKSFAHRIELDFRPGINAIVGPNGSGKSNIIDAIRWVLGEQSIKTLRGSKLEDVIFTGSNLKKPMGMAEVAITLDNSDRLIPLDYSEVSFIRRAFRSGESEFYINKTLCRLKDIQELLVDTGIGKDGYSIISQGRIDEMLAYRPEERRLIFEEAAGIMKHKVRKNEAEKRLEETMDNIARIDDILGEIEYQLGPLAIQKDTALKYMDISEDYRELEVNMLLMGYKNKEKKLRQVKDIILEKQSILDDTNRQLEVLNTTLLDYKTQAEEYEKIYEDFQGQLFSTRSQRKDYQKETDWIENEKTRLIKENQGNIERIYSEEKKIREIKNTLNVKIQELEQKIKDINQLEIEIEEKEKKLQFIQNNADKREKLIESLKGDVIDLLNYASQKRNIISSLNTMKQNLDNRLKQIERDELQIDEANEKTSREIRCIEEEIKGLENSISDTQKEVENLRNEIKIKTIEAEKGQKHENDTQQDLSTAVSRLKALKEISDNFEGFQFGVKNLLLAIKDGAYTDPGIYGTVADVITVKQKYELAIETALGGSLQNIICDSEENAKQAIDYLKRSDLGRVTFLPLTAIRSRSLSSSEKFVLDLAGCLSTAVDLVTYDKRYHPAIANLLGRVLVADCLDNAVVIARKSGFAFKIVTLRGEVLNPGGSITGGSQKRSYFILSRKRQLSEGKDKIDKLNEQLEKIKQENYILKELIDEKKEVIESKVNFLYDAKGQIIALDKQREEKQNLLEERFDRRKQLEVEKQQILSETREIISEISTVENDIGDLDTKNVSSQSKVKELQVLMVEDKQKIENLSKIITEKKVMLASNRQEEITLKQNIQTLEENQMDKTKEIKDLRDKIKENEDELLTIEEKIINNRKKIEALLNKEKELERNIEDLREKKDAIKNDGEKKQTQLNKLTVDRRSLEKTLHKSNIEENTMSIKLSQIVDRLLEKYSLTIEEAKKLERDLGSLEDIKDRLSKLHKELESLGPVNLKAIEDYENLKKRYDFLKTQRDDLIEGKDKLDSLVQGITKTMEEILFSAIQEINKEFKKVFTEMFGGGKAELIIDDEKGILECGIDINAQPPGKKLQSLSLLSGGERALTAIALLFAILNTKATPFCILDEIEAALDDANIDRFTQYLKKVSKHTQCIIITHRKRTMEVADALYGIAMEETAISKVLSVKIGKELSSSAN